jgi:hypothetical protein
MPYTSHGHAFGWVNTDEPRLSGVARCGGPRLCKKCAAEAATAPADPRDREITSLRLDVDRFRLYVERLQGIVSRMAEIPREPAALPDEHASVYLRGWQDARALVDKALLPEEGQA